MDRRSWPWKKKSSPKQSSEATLPEAQHSGSNASPSHRTSRKEDHVAMLKSYAEQLNEACQRYQQAEDKIKVLNSQLVDARKEIGEKESLVKQHIKVAEDAVSGWEKAETEAANTKQELETALEQKSELEEQVVFLTETMKENQRKAKEELDRKLFELTTKKNKEVEKIKTELEGRLSEVGQRLLESTAECKVLASTLQERMRKIAELNDSRSKAESEIGVLNARLESKDKEAMGLRYEIQVLNKELQIRNEEKDYCRKEADVAHRQQLEGVKKIQMLEAECQRLRTLVRRKLPGPAAVAQMKQEVDSWSRDERRRSLGSKPDRGSKDFQIQLLTERLLSMEEETKMLREVLAQRNCELQAARSPMNNEASTVRATPTRTRTVASECSFADEAGSCADAWSSAISELDQFRSKEKSSNSNSPKLLMDDTKFQMMDDFAEMEQLASSSTKDGQQQQLLQQQGPKLEELLSEKEKELNAANKLVADISSKLLATEKDFSALKEKNSANEASIVKLQEKLDLLLDSQAEKQNSASVTVTTEALSANVHKVVCLVEALAQAIGVGDHDESCLTSPSSSSSSSPSHCSFEKLMNVSNRLNEGKMVDLAEFVGELSSVLKNMTLSISSAENVNGAVVRKEVSSDSTSNEGLRKENGLLQAEVGKLRHELNRLKTEKEMLHQSCEKAKERIRELESELTQVQGMLSELRTKESELVSARAEWEERVRDSDATVNKLREKLNELEGQYQAEKDQHESLLVKYQQVETELNGKGKESDTNDNGHSEDIAVKLAECQRTILALGKQLKLLSSPKAAPEATSHSRVNSVSSSMDKQLSSVDDDLEPEVSNNWSDQQRWSPTKKFERSSSATPEQCDSSSWLYSPERTPARTMRSPGRFLSSSHEISELSRTPKSNNPSSFSRFFSRGRGN